MYYIITKEQFVHACHSLTLLLLLKRLLILNPSTGAYLFKIYIQQFIIIFDCIFILTCPFFFLFFSYTTASMRFIRICDVLSYVAVKLMLSPKPSSKPFGGHFFIYSLSGRTRKPHSLQINGLYTLTSVHILYINR